jgi:DNA-binding PadR family transcriptional regulator
MKGTHLGEFEELVLLVIAILTDDAYVLKIQQELKEQVNRSASMGALHATLTRLEKKGFLKSAMEGASNKRGGRRKRVYQVTNTGKETINQAKELRMNLWNQVPSYSLKIAYA